MGAAATTDPSFQVTGEVGSTVVEDLRSHPAAMVVVVRVEDSCQEVEEEGDHRFCQAAAGMVVICPPMVVVVAAAVAATPFSEEGTIRLEHLHREAAWVLEVGAPSTWATLTMTTLIVTRLVLATMVSSKLKYKIVKRTVP